jgi:methyl-accepting chemotaxis protein
MKWSLRNRLLLPVLGLIIIGMGTLTGASYYNSKTDLERAITGQISQLADSAHSALAAWERDRRLDIRSWAESNVYKTAVQDSFVGRAAATSANQTLSDLKEQYGYYENICVADEKGVLVSAADQSVLGSVQVSDRDYFQASLKGELFITGVIMSRGTGNPVFVIAAPLQDKGKVVGSLFGVIDVNTFSSRFIDPIKVGETGYAYIYDIEGNVIAHPNKDMILNLNMKEFDFGREMMAQGSGQITYTYEGIEKAVAFRKLEGLGWTVGVGASTEELFAPVRVQAFWNLGVATVVVLAAIALLLLLIRSVVGPLNRIIEGLHEGTYQVTSASNQVSAASQSLAEGASEQAASIEETSSSLEEMSSMTKQNAGNAEQANTLMAEAKQVVGSANSSMTEMVSSMQEIREASEETSKIIKTIDEIAFQTNLLALNAAVEAARAGEAGAGFAVVADEVRNLALRAAEAAKNTSALIEGTTKKVQDGSALVERTNGEFSKVERSAMKVAELVGEIAAASREQAEGIDQVNVAVADMDKVTQQNAANAEESASASEEMNRQAEQMKAMVDELVALVGGAGEHQEGGRAVQTRAVKGQSRQGKARRLNAGSGAGNSAPAVRHSGKEVTPEKAIPLDDDDSFKDF